MSANQVRMAQMINKMAAVVCHHGQLDYAAALAQDQSLTVTLCGLEVFYKDNQPVRFKAHNLDLVIKPHPLAAIANDTLGRHAIFHDDFNFQKGGFDTVLRWYNCICAFQSVLRTDAKAAA